LQMVCHDLNIYANSWVVLALWHGDGHRKLVTRFGVIRRVKWKIWFRLCLLRGCFIQIENAKSYLLPRHHKYCGSSTMSAKVHAPPINIAVLNQPLIEAM